MTIFSPNLYAFRGFCVKIGFIYLFIFIFLAISINYLFSAIISIILASHLLSLISSCYLAISTTISSYNRTSLHSHHQSTSAFSITFILKLNFTISITFLA
jgi:hypothetical protein